MFTDKPILSPLKEHEWERKAVFNAVSSISYAVDGSQRRLGWQDIL